MTPQQLDQLKKYFALLPTAEQILLTEGLNDPKTALHLAIADRTRQRLARLEGHNVALLLAISVFARPGSLATTETLLDVLRTGSQLLENQPDLLEAEGFQAGYQQALKMLELTLSR